ncbi:hypothetical protein ARMGADRAFT_1074964 [Armillaria gallica]|uniref:Uncharacterized protein n=1 Tax=Armillaria gallica TaxID=47427 RepID=A0A2H3E9Q1_ARMGA|nr:hypothetical protein ARMGADRAFT_1074964 [Armillaria gallica]
MALINVIDTMQQHGVPRRNCPFHNTLVRLSWKRDDPDECSSSSPLQVKSSPLRLPMNSAAYVEHYAIRIRADCKYSSFRITFARKTKFVKVWACIVKATLAEISIDLLVERHRGYAPKLTFTSWHGMFNKGKLPIVIRTRILPRDRGRLLQAARAYAVHAKTGVKPVKLDLVGDAGSDFDEDDGTTLHLATGNSFFCQDQYYGQILSALHPAYEEPSSAGHPL